MFSQSSMVLCNSSCWKDNVLCCPRAHEMHSGESSDSMISRVESWLFSLTKENQRRVMINGRCHYHFEENNKGENTQIHREVNVMACSLDG